jgi:hypothetical protein
MQDTAKVSQARPYESGKAVSAVVVITIPMRRANERGTFT